MRYVFWLLIACIPLQGNAMVPDTTAKKQKWVPDSTHTPKKAALFSAVLPGAGQLYNRRYWKAPIVWGALGTSTYFIIDNHQQYNYWRAAYLDRLVDPNVHLGTELDIYSDDNLRTISDVYRRQRDFSYIITGILYTLQVIEASVDAHFLHFDDGNDLSLRVSPTFLQNTASFSTTSPGLRLTLKF